MAEIDRNKKLAELKASIEMLEECKQRIMDNKKLDEAAKKDRCEQVDEAIKENYEKARMRCQATKEEVDGAKYNEVSEEYKAKYAEHLKKRGISDEQVHRKEQAVVMVATGEGVPAKTRRHKSKRTQMREEEEGFDATKVERLSNEEELMNQTLLKDKKDFERRRHRSTDTMSDTPMTKDNENVVGTVIESRKVKPRERSSTLVTVDGTRDDAKRESKRVMESGGNENMDYTFDPSTIPSHIQYDILPLPSNGECYPHKKNRIPVAYLTAADENIIASPNMYRDGKIIGIILERKILDKDIKVDELCKGDRDAIVLWLRATGYGTDFPIIARHPDTGKQYPINVKLDTFKYYPFNLKGDENGFFEYKAENGDVIKFKYLNVMEENELRDDIIARTTDFEKFTAVKYINRLQGSVSRMTIEDGDKNELNDCLADMKDIINVEGLKINEDNLYVSSITSQMIKYTMSVNGNTDREFIKGYIENMRAKEALAYRTYVNDNTPGVNMNITVNVPQSDGGGTFDTFLGIDDYVFGNI